MARREARISVQPLWGFSSSNPHHSQSRAEHLICVCHGAVTGGWLEPTGISDLDEKLLPLYWQRSPIQLESDGSLCCIHDSSDMSAYICQNF